VHPDVRTSNLNSKKLGSKWAPERFLADYGAGLSRMKDTAEFDFRHNASGIRIELKAARIKDCGAFKFQYIRPECFDLCICLAWQNGSPHRYWIFDTTDLKPPRLTRQHRGGRSFQLSIRTDDPIIQPGNLRVELDRKAKSACRHRKLVRLNTALKNVKGWPSVADSIERQMRGCGFDNWIFVIDPLRDIMDGPDSYHILRSLLMNKGLRCKCIPRK
jgi:hypothetical protein